MIKFTIIGLLMLATADTFAQSGSVGIGTTTPNTNAILDITATNKGVLLPRVALQGTNVSAPLSAHVAGMLVYNTAPAGTPPNNVTPGTYYNDGTKWLRVGDNAQMLNIYNADGQLSGNRTVNLGSNFLKLDMGNAVGALQFDQGHTATNPRIISFDSLELQTSSNMRQLCLIPEGKVVVNSRLVLTPEKSVATPATTSDTDGEKGEVVYDNFYMYIKLPVGWKRVALSEF